MSQGCVWVWGRFDHLSLRGVSQDIPVVRQNSKRHSIRRLYEITISLRLLNSSFFLQPAKLSDEESVKAIGDICRVECGSGCTFILNDFGDVFVFGKSNSRCLGLGPGVSPFFIPVKVPNLQSIIDIRVGVNFCMAVNVDGEVWQWGTVLEWDPCIMQAT